MYMVVSYCIKSLLWTQYFCRAIYTSRIGHRGAPCGLDHWFGATVAYQIKEMWSSEIFQINRAVLLHCTNSIIAATILETCSELSHSIKIGLQRCYKMIRQHSIKNGNSESLELILLQHSSCLYRVSLSLQGLVEVHNRSLTFKTWRSISVLGRSALALLPPKQYVLYAICYPGLVDSDQIQQVLCC